jgi:hypothetical protein
VEAWKLYTIPACRNQACFKVITDFIDTIFPPPARRGGVRKTTALAGGKTT